MLQITPFGWLFLPFVLLILLRYASWLPALLPVAAMLHAPAAIVVGKSETALGFGITPWLVVAFAIFVKTCLMLWRTPGTIRERDISVDPLMAGWAVFTAWGVLSAFTLPFMFEGLQTYDSGNRLGTMADMAPLQWRLGNAVQAANLLVILMLFFYGMVQRNPRSLTSSLAVGYIAAALLSIGFSVAQRLLIGTDASSYSLIQESLNPSYLHTTGNLFSRDAIRVGWPFSEPSYASAWFASLFSAGLGLALWGRWRTGLALLALAGAGLLNSFSATGIVGAAAASFALLGCALILAIRRYRSTRDPKGFARPAILILALVCVLGIVASVANRYVISHPEMGSRTLSHAVIGYLWYKANDFRRQDNSRTKSNREAVSIIAETSGFGVGLGSNRASSQALNFASNVGVLAALLLLVLVTAQWILLVRSPAPSFLRLLICCGSLGMLIACAVGIPDLLWPAWWVWPITAFWLLCAQRGASSSSVASTHMVRVSSADGPGN